MESTSKVSYAECATLGGYFAYVKKSEMVTALKLFGVLCEMLSPSKEGKRIYARTHAARVYEVYKKQLNFVKAKSLPEVTEHYLRAEIDFRKGEQVARISVKSLAVGQALAYRVRVSNTTGKATYNVGAALPLFPGDTKFITNAAKKRISDKGYFAVSEVVEDKKVRTTIYQVQKIYTPVLDKHGKQVLKSDGTPKMQVSQIRAVRADGMIERYSAAETAFKKGVSNVLSKVIAR